MPLVKLNTVNHSDFNDLLQYRQEIIRIFAEESNLMRHIHTQTILKDLDTLEKEGVIPKARKAAVEKIRKMLKQ